MLLTVFLVFLMIYRLLGLPSPEELVKIANGYYSKYGYFVVLLGALIEGTLFVNWYLPGSTVVALGVVFARENSTSVVSVIAIIIFGFFVSGMFNYFMGKYGWYHVFMKIGLKQPLEKVRVRVKEKGLPIILGTYFHPNIGALIATCAGILKLPFLKFLGYSLVALVVWNSLWGAVVYFTGPLILKFLGRWVVGAALVLWIIFLAVRFFVMKRKKLVVTVP